ncbi:hypothetical protein [Halorhabdus amylolytica]|uniref:hypothetical protein n=1 Tax=Halorhabdus amylolytica TaxID=2559573 RepID=UPI0010AA6F42|nr:hypothetical protein [Halorhabdus amylolytica]
MSERYKASDDELRTRRQLTNRVGNELSRNEQETGIQFFGDADRFQITTYRPTMVRSLLRHAYAEIERLYLGVPEGQNKRVENPSEVLTSEARPEVEGVRATLPLGTLTVKGKPRTKDQHSGIITTPEEIEGLSEAFAD